MNLNLGARGLTTKLQHDYEFSNFDLGGVSFDNVKLKSVLNYKNSSNINESDSNVGRVYQQSRTISGTLWESKEIEDWCRAGSTSQTTCIDGGWGTKEMGQEQWSLSEELSGDFLLGSFLLGADYTSTQAYRRRPEEFTYYTASTVIGSYPALSGFNCNGADACSAEQFANTKSVHSAYDINVNLNAFNVYAELNQTWEWLNVRAGVRASYDDYMQNLNLAPRIVATVSPIDDFSISAGFNRYFDATNLGYALRERLPRETIYTRSQSSGNVTEWGRFRVNVPYENRASDLSTPFNDEITFAVFGKEPLLGGDWRVRFLDRRSKDQFATENTSTYVNTLTNSGHGAYQSVTGEYSKELDTGSVEALDALSFKASVTWARSEITNNSYFESNLEDEYILYKEHSYSQAGFQAATGNMDIPLRLQAGFASSWFDNRLNVDVSANYNFGYRGVRDTGDTTNIDGLEHSIYEDYDFSPTLTVDLATSYEVYKNDDRGLTFNMKVGNLFNETGNATTSIARPWSIGRTVWVGAKATF